jgi:hypothetical protein
LHGQWWNVSIATNPKFYASKYGKRK